MGSSTRPLPCASSSPSPPDVRDPSPQEMLQEQAEGGFSFLFSIKVRASKNEWERPFLRVGGALSDGWQLRGAEARGKGGLGGPSTAHLVHT